MRADIAKNYNLEAEKYGGAQQLHKQVSESDYMDTIGQHYQPDQDDDQRAA